MHYMCTVPESTCIYLYLPVDVPHSIHHHSKCNISGWFQTYSAKFYVVQTEETMIFDEQFHFDNRKWCLDVEHCGCIKSE